jgi:hypothetical protein
MHRFTGYILKALSVPAAKFCSSIFVAITLAWHVQLRLACPWTLTFQQSCDRVWLGPKFKTRSTCENLQAEVPRLEVAEGFNWVRHV